MQLTPRQALVLRAFSVWTVWVWGTRLWNIWRDDHDLAFKAVHSVLALVSVAFAAGCWLVVRSNRKRRSVG